MNLKECRINDFDDIFETTRLTEGYDKAVVTVLYVLFDIQEENIKSISNKYLFISRDRNARKKAMLLQKEDLGHILIKYCMSSFGLRDTWFNIDDNDMFEFTVGILKNDMSAYELIEYFAYAAMCDVNNAYSLLYENKDVLSKIVKSMMEERYALMLKDRIDLFTGVINNDKIERDLRYKFYDSYNKLDDDFEEIKRNSTDYIR